MDKVLVKTGFWALGKGLQAVSQVDDQVRKELAFFPEGFKVTLEVFPGDIAVSWQKSEGKMKFLGMKKVEADLLVRIKSLKAAVRMILAKLGIATAYAQRRVAIEGNTVYAMVLTRMLDRTEAYLFPAFMTRSLFKQRIRFGAKEYMKNAFVYLRLLV